MITDKDTIAELRGHIVQLQARIILLEAELVKKEEWYTTGNPVPYKPADGQW